MLNLLFISNSPKSEFIINALQPQLKVKIDSVADFDHGLKAVFEKRPATVIIQDQIAGVTGESVARHIQMLLGSGAPSFIMIHEGNARIMPIKGLFEHLIDLTQPDAKLVEDILVILKSMLGPEWDKAIITPKLDPAAIAASIAVPEENRGSADKLVDDFLTDLENTHNSGKEDGSRQFSQAESATDKLARLLVETANSDKSRAESVAPEQPSPPDVFSEASLHLSGQEELPVMSGEHTPRKPPSETTTSGVLPKIATPTPAPADMNSSVPGDTVLSSSKIPEPVVLTLSAPENENKTCPENGAEASKSPPFAADFKLPVSSDENQEEIPEDLLLAFEKNYHAQASLRKRLGLAFVLIAVFGVAGWLLLRQKPRSVSTQLAPNQAATTATQKQRNVLADKPPVATPKAPSSRKPPTTADSALSALVTNGTRDDSFAARKPGWERYVNKAYECRLFRSNGQIKALQVLANSSQTISDAFMHSVLEGVTGKSSFNVDSTEQKHGYLIQRASALDKKADLLIYRKKTSGAIRAFVICIN